MLDMLFRFNVARIAASYIGKEISEFAGNVGSPWHIFYIVWSVFFGITDLVQNGPHVGSASAVLFIVATSYLAYSEYVPQKKKWFKYVEFEFIKKLARLSLNITIPIVMFFYVWNPIRNAAHCAYELWSGKDEGLWPIITVGLATSLTLIIRLLVCKKVNRAADSSVSSKTQTPGGQQKQQLVPPPVSKKPRPHSANPAAGRLVSEQDDTTARSRDRDDGARPKEI